MSRPLRIQYPGAYYHVTCRGNGNQKIFKDVQDHEEFMHLLTRSVDIFGVRVLAYALMPDHFNLLVCTPKSNLAEFMRHFNISYTGAFNRRYKRSGHLYQGRYKAFLIDKDNYLLEVSRYIHLTPLRIKSKESLDKRWQDLLISESTSLPGYLNRKSRKDYIDYSTILENFGESGKASRNYKKFITEGMAKDIPNPLERGKGTSIIGDRNFVDKIRKLIGSDRNQQKGDKTYREQPALRKLEKTATPEEVISYYTKIIKRSREDLTARGKQFPERAMLMELLYRFCKITQPEIGKLTGNIDYSAVSQARKRLREKMINEPSLGNQFNEIQDKLSKKLKVKI